MQYFERRLSVPRGSRNDDSKFRIYQSSNTEEKIEIGSIINCISLSWFTSWLQLVASKSQCTTTEYSTESTTDCSLSYSNVWRCWSHQGQQSITRASLLCLQRSWKNSNSLRHSNVPSSAGTNLSLVQHFNSSIAAAPERLMNANLCTELGRLHCG